MLANSHESGRNEEGKVTRSHKETWAAPSTKETSASLVILTPRASLFTERTIPTSEKELIIFHAHSRYRGDLALSVSTLVTAMLRHHDHDERQRDGSRHWDSIKPVLMKAFAHKGARDIDDGKWLRLIHEGCTKKRLEYCQDKDGNLSYFRAIQGHSGGIPISPKLIKYTRIPYDWKKYLYLTGSQWFFSLFWEWSDSGRKRGGQSSPSCLSDSIESFWKGPGRGEASFPITQFFKKLHMKPIGNATKMLCIKE